MGWLVYWGCFMPSFKNMKELSSFLQDVVNMELEDSLAQVIKDGLSTSAESNVYGAYSPSIYSRRHSLSDQENMDSHLISDGVLEVKMAAEFNDGYGSSNVGDQLAGLVEYGHGWNGYYYDYSDISGGDDAYLYPRPFIQPVREDIGDNLKDLMRQALKNAGLKVQ